MVNNILVKDWGWGHKFYTVLKWLEIIFFHRKDTLGIERDFRVLIKLAPLSMERAEAICNSADEAIAKHPKLKRILNSVKHP